ncbi:VOC family protein [Salinivibrio socompensis]|uniref:VOC family protein n=1 Tax=Salinivibrio socompensis TaxID=1510206 RepID=UPI000471B25D|nr:VOC family protein [Salinivibrio socompensis]
MEARISIITLGVADLSRSYEFYRQLGFPTHNHPEEGIVFFSTAGTRLALYAIDALADDIKPGMSVSDAGFSGITLAHNTRSKEEVDEVLALAKECGGRIVKPAQDVFWGGYSGYFADPDNHLWEVAYGDSWQFDDNGSLVLD